MSVSLPPEVKYGFVADRILLAVGDTTDDEDRYPDAVPARGTVTFTPVQVVHRTEATPVTIIRSPIICTFHQGAADTTDPDPAKAGLLIDPAGHVGNVALATGHYEVSYKIDGGTVPGFTISVEEKHTSEEPLWLPYAAPITPSPAVKLVVNEQLYLDTQQVRDEMLELKDQILGNLLVIKHGSDPDVPRPAEIGAAYWIGEVEPLNAIDGDLWVGGIDNQADAPDDLIARPPVGPDPVYTPVPIPLTGEENSED